MTDNSAVKVGDTVFVTDSNIPGEFTGTHGIVKTVDTTDPALPIFVEFHDTLTDRRRVFWVRKGEFSVTEAPLKEGDIVVISGRGDEHDGREGVYVGPDGGGGRHHIRINGDDLYFYDRHFTRPLPTDIVEPSVADLHAQISRLNDELATQASRATRAEERLTVQQERYTHDMQAIDRIMRDVKIEQSWCDDGWNEVVERVNEALEGGYEFESIRQLVKKRVRMSGNVILSKDVWMYEGDDEDDADNWLDEDGEALNIDVDEALCEEASDNGWDDKEITVQSARY